MNLPTLGAVLVGVVLIAWELSNWFPGVKALRAHALGHVGDLVPFFLSWCVGALAIMVVGGLVGWAGDVAMWGLGIFGDGVLIYGVGAKSGTVPGSASAPLTEGGLFMTVIVLAVFFARSKKGETSSKWRGLLSGLCMGLSAGVARYAAIPLASLVNAAGVWITGAVA